MKTKQPAVEIINLSKKFIIPKYNRNSLKEILVNGLFKNEKTEHQVLDDINLKINKGDFFGIVGRNGSGKSTLLKLICGIYAPDTGEVKLHGKLTPFIELGVGFNPELSGRDNVYLNGALLGFTRKQMDEMYQSIVDFAEIEEFMDLKLKNYSSGMQVRLAFSIAIKAKNDILIFDEVLAVGDEAFQRKCMDVFEDYRRNKQTVILVTHSMENVKRLCNKALMIEDGKIKIMGSVKAVANAYQQANAAVDPPEIKEPEVKSVPKHIELTGCAGAYYQNDSMELQIQWPRDCGIAKFGVAIFGAQGEYVFGSNTGEMSLGSTGVDYSVELRLGSGKYYLNVASLDKKGGIIEHVDKIAEFSIYDDFNTEVAGLTRLEFEYNDPKKQSKETK